MKTAVILGGSGLVGSFLLEALLEDERIAEVHSFARTALDQENTKLSQHLGDLINADFWKLKLKADLLFVCIGTTKSKTPDPDLYFKIDHDIPVLAAEWAAKNGLSRFLVVSSLGADPGARNSYLRIKGKMERDVRAAFPDTVAFRPSMILGPREESRILESIGKGLFKALGPLIPKAYQGVEAEDIARAMLRISMADKAPELVPSEDIGVIAKA